MSMKRTISCDICGGSYTEEVYGAGFPGWAIINGIAAKENGEMAMHLCPEHTKKLVPMLTALQEEVRDGVGG